MDEDELSGRALYEDHHDWIEQLMAYCLKDDQGNLIIPPHIVGQWEYFSQRAYSDLTSDEREQIITRAQRFNWKFQYTLDKEFDQMALELKRCQQRIAELEQRIEDLEATRSVEKPD